MQPYWIDSNIFIDAANGPYTFKRAPSYWSFLDDNLNFGAICTSEMVYRELVVFGDELSRWVKNRKQKGLCKQADLTVQTQLKGVVDGVLSCGRYTIENIDEFLRGADPWIIAHAKVTNGTVVTNESALRPNARKVRIPDICADNGVSCVSGYEMLDQLNFVI